MIEFKFPHLKEEWSNAHPELEGFVQAFEKWSAENKLPHPVITEVARDDQTQLDYYVPYARGILKRYREGTLTSLEEKAHLHEIRETILRNKDEEIGIATWALKRFTWHRVAPIRCAVDLRNKHYNLGELGKVGTWLIGEVRRLEGLNAGRQWDFRIHDVGRGNHIHVGYRDLGAQATYLRNWHPDLTRLRIPPP